MKKINVVLFLALLAGLLTTVSCSQSRKAAQDTSAAPAPAANPEMAAWNKNVDAYHAIMSSTFHPAEEGNLEPLKSQAENLAARAADWAAAPVPMAMKGKVEGPLRKLADDSKKIAEMVKNKASDQALTDAITKLHDVFHGLMEVGGGGH